MTEKKGPFDAAISLLRELKLDKFGILIPSDHPQINSAIRVLKAAGKVDKKLALINLVSGHWQGGIDEYDYRSIRALLRALPDKEEK